MHLQWGNVLKKKIKFYSFVKVFFLFDKVKSLLSKKDKLGRLLLALRDESVETFVMGKRRQKTEVGKERVRQNYSHFGTRTL